MEFHSNNQKNNNNSVQIRQVLQAHLYQKVQDQVKRLDLEITIPKQIEGCLGFIHTYAGDLSPVKRPLGIVRLRKEPNRLEPAATALYSPQGYLRLKFRNGLPTRTTNSLMGTMTLCHGGRRLLSLI